MKATQIDHALDGTLTPEMELIFKIETMDEEMEKAHIADKYGADTITDLSMGGDISAIRKSIFENTSLPITTVPIYQDVVEKGLMDITADAILSYPRAMRSLHMKCRSS